jgi:tetratricopeptide (TPR) repeat protein
MQWIAYSYLFFAILCGVGLEIVLKKYRIYLTYNKFIMSLVIILFFLIPFLITLQKVREDNDSFVENLSKTQLSFVPKNGVLLAWSDSLYFPALTLQYVRNYRPDITLVQTSLLNSLWYQENITQQHPFMKKYIVDNHIDYKKMCVDLGKQGNLYMSPWYQEFELSWENAGCQQIPFGLIVKIVPIKQQPSLDQLKEFNDRVWKTFKENNSASMARNSQGYQRKREALFYLSEFYNFQGIFYNNYKKTTWAYDIFLRSKDISPDQVNAIVGLSALLAKDNRLQEAISVLEEGVKRNPVSPALYKNLGVLYQKMGNLAKAVENFQIYLSFNPTNDPEVTNISLFVNQYHADESRQSLVP